MITRECRVGVARAIAGQQKKGMHIMIVPVDSQQLGERCMKSLLGALLLVVLMQPTISLAGRPVVSGAVVVGGYPGYGPRGGYYYGPRGGYYGSGWRGYGPGVGVYFGAPLVWGWPWGAPAYYPPPVVYPPVATVPPAVVYVEQGEVSAEPMPGTGEVLEPGYWYYCRERGAYYPAVRQCAGGWEKVAPVNK
jgi:hypothetical protein